MYLFLIIALLGILLFVTYRMHSSLSALAASTKQLLNLTEVSLKTRGGLFPVASQYEIMVERELMEESLKGYKYNTQYASEEYIAEHLKAGKVWFHLKSAVEEHFAAKLRADEHEAIGNQMVLANLDVFHNRKTIEQAEEGIEDVKMAYSGPFKKWMESQEREKEYLERIRVTFDRLTEKKEG